MAQQATWKRRFTSKQWTSSWTGTEKLLTVAFERRGNEGDDLRPRRLSWEQAHSRCMSLRVSDVGLERGRAKEGPARCRRQRGKLPLRVGVARRSVLVLGEPESSNREGRCWERGQEATRRFSLLSLRSTHPSSSTPLPETPAHPQHPPQHPTVTPAFPSLFPPLPTLRLHDSSLSSTSARSTSSSSWTTSEPLSDTNGHLHQPSQAFSGCSQTPPRSRRTRKRQRLELQRCTIGGGPLLLAFHHSRTRRRF